MKYPKRSQYKHAKQKKYHVRNWAEYNEGLRRRGDLTVWFDEEAIANWMADKTGKPGGQRVYNGTDVSALDHILAGEQTISPNKGLFLKETWRLHPDISAYTSELFYEGKLSSKAGLEKQIIIVAGSISGSGLRYLPVEHNGNQNSSPEEAQALSTLVEDILESNVTWVDRDGQERPIALGDILIITPYNAQVFEIQQRLPGARVGTVDKFQGQEAPIAIYSTATSSHADAPRGMEFLYSLNRLNVATSRAKCVSIMVSSPQIFESECRTPQQMRLANAFCRYLEMADRLASQTTPPTCTDLSTG